MKIVLGCQRADELPSLCEDFFGPENIEIVDRNGGLSLDEVAIIIQIADLTVSTIAFLFSVLVDWKKKKNSDNKNTELENDDKVSSNSSSRRVLITKAGDINLEGYSAEEVERILKTLKEAE